MQTPLKVTDRLDHLDAERFRDMVLSPPFQTYRRRIEAELERARGECERCDDWNEVRLAQGRAAALHAVLGLPATILGEIERAEK